MSRAAIRTVFIVFFTAIALLWNAGDLLLPWHPFAVYGFSAAYDGTITGVDSDGAARGLHVGDRVDVKKMSFQDRGVFGPFPLAPPGSRMVLPMQDGRAFVVVSHVRARSLADNVSDIFAVLSTLAFTLIAAILVLLRPSPVTWAFYAFAYSFGFTGTLGPEYAPAGVLAVATVLTALSYSITGPAFIVFALRFPDSTPQGFWRNFERVILYVVAPAMIVGNAGFALAYEMWGGARPQWGSDVFLVLLALTNPCAIAILIMRYAGAREADRNRLRWVVAAFSVAFLPILIASIAQEANSRVAVPWVENTVQTWEVIAPIALAYTILKHRLFDIRFVLSRALVYAILTSLTVGVLALADWGFGVWLAQSRFALVAEVGLALILGVTLTTVHKRTEKILNSIVFRSQMIALAALRRFAQETDLIPDPQHLIEQAYEALRGRLECDYVAVYTGEGSSFARATPDGARVPQLLAGHDLAVLRLKRWHEPFECDEPGHALRGALLLPMTARGQLVGFIVCGPKLDRTHYLPEEIETLSLLTHRTGSAYALLTMSAAAPMPVTT
ncbi:MAG TPA: hypothetical protein VJP85_11175 [Candidatus Baltobacteraceae bacterium]|nr:hypothetical protein [Candidatus Baltobacteraceae bacterium]